jgi:hypothetical protein
LWNLKQERIEPERLARIGAMTKEVLSRSRASDRAPITVALELARERLQPDH